MSYPEPTYHGQDGEPSATLRPSDAAPELTYPNGNRVHYLATGTTTGGLYGTVVGLKDEVVQLRIADQVRVEVGRVAIAGKQPEKEEAPKG